jgi:hypothetical protein
MRNGEEKLMTRLKSNLSGCPLFAALTAALALSGLLVGCGSSSSTQELRTVAPSGITSPSVSLDPAELDHLYARDPLTTRRGGS